MKTRENVREALQGAAINHVMNALVEHVSVDGAIHITGFELTEKLFDAFLAGADWTTDLCLKELEERQP